MKMIGKTEKNHTLCKWYTYMHLGQGKELYRWHAEVARNHGVSVYYSCPATSLMECSIASDVIGSACSRT